MLIKNDKTRKTKSEFICDRCKTILTSNSKYAIYVQESKAVPKKKWDLCKRCYSALLRGIEKK